MKLLKAIGLLVRNTFVNPEQRQPVTKKQKSDARQRSFEEISKIYDDMR